MVYEKISLKKYLFFTYISYQKKKTNIRTYIQTHTYFIAEHYASLNLPVEGLSNERNSLPRSLQRLHRES